MNITDISGIGDTTAQRLKAHGIVSVEAVARASIEQLVAVPGIGADRAVALRQSAMRLLPEAADARESGAAPVRTDHRAKPRKDKEGKKDRKDKKKDGKRREKQKKTRKKEKKKKKKEDKVNKGRRKGKNRRK